MSQIGIGFPSTPTEKTYPKRSALPERTLDKKAASFEEVLSGKFQEVAAARGLRFSRHASERLSQRKIQLSPEQNERLLGGVAKANEKGIRDSLVLLDSFAFIVNIPSQTVVTAMDREESKEKAFTNIDGAVIA